MGDKSQTADQEKLIMASYKAGLAKAYLEACRIYDRDDAAGVDELGMIDNILAALAKLAERPCDRSWWKRIYKAGIRADLDKQPRMPPDDLTEDQKEVWLAGYDQ